MNVNNFTELYNVCLLFFFFVVMADARTRSPLSFAHVHGSTSRLNLERGCDLSTMRVKWMPALFQIVMLFSLELDCHKNDAVEL